MFAFDPRAGRARALEEWRDAARVVSERWAAWLKTEAESRPFAFALYLAALDAEEWAAASLAEAAVANPGGRRPALRKRARG